MRIAAIDFEASSLNGWPIDAGWMRDGDAAPRSMLIKRQANFHIDLWSGEAESIHKITLDDLERDGIEPKIIIEAMATDLDGYIVISDSPDHDIPWLCQMQEAAGVETLPFKISEPSTAVRLLAQQSQISEWQGHEKFQRALDNEAPAEHRAGSDAAQLLKCLLAIRSK